MSVMDTQYPASTSLGLLAGGAYLAFPSKLGGILLRQRNPEHGGLCFCNYSSCDLKWREKELFVAQNSIPSIHIPGVSASGESPQCYSTFIQQIDTTPLVR